MMALIHHYHDADYSIRTLPTSGLPIDLSPSKEHTKDLNDDPFNQFIITDQLDVNDNHNPNKDGEYIFLEGYDDRGTGTVFDLSDMAFKMDLDDDVNGGIEPFNSIGKETGTEAEDVLKLWSCYPATTSLSSSPLPAAHLPDISTIDSFYSRSGNVNNSNNIQYDYPSTLPSGTTGRGAISNSELLKLEGVSTESASTSSFSTSLPLPPASPPSTPVSSKEQQKKKTTPVSLGGSSSPSSFQWRLSQAGGGQTRAVALNKRKYSRKALPSSPNVMPTSVSHSTPTTTPRHSRNGSIQGVPSTPTDTVVPAATTAGAAAATSHGGVNGVSTSNTFLISPPPSNRLPSHNDNNNNNNTTGHHTNFFTSISPILSSPSTNNRCPSQHVRKSSHQSTATTSSVHSQHSHRVSSTPSTQSIQTPTPTPTDYSPHPLLQYPANMNYSPYIQQQNQWWDISAPMESYQSHVHPLDNNLEDNTDMITSENNSLHPQNLSSTLSTSGLLISGLEEGQQNSSPPSSPRQRRQTHSPPARIQRPRTRASRSTAQSSSAISPGSKTTMSFVNFTPQDSATLLGGVAPSGSSKTKAKREKEAAENRRKLSAAAVKAVAAAGGDLSVLSREGGLVL